MFIEGKNDDPDQGFGRRVKPRCGKGWRGVLKRVEAGEGQKGMGGIERIVEFVC